MNPIELSLFHQRLDAICDEMGLSLQRAAVSPNIKDRLDYSCAIFDRKGLLCAQAAHIPVHLGSMAYAMSDLVHRFDWSEGDMVWLNDPYLGGTHLPDITVLAPVFYFNELVGFVANRAHHADIGAKTGGSMPVASQLSDEGVVIAPSLLMQAGQLLQSSVDMLLSSLKHAKHGYADILAQTSANLTGLSRLSILIEQHGNADEYQVALDALQQYGARMAKAGIGRIPTGCYAFEDVMDDDGQGNTELVIKLNLSVSETEIIADFSGSAKQVAGNINCPESVVAAAVYYVLRCLMPVNTPACAGSFSCISLHVPKGSMLNPYPGAAVAAGNVETSMRLVDVVMGALARALPEQIPAASQGTMNNIALGSIRGEQANDREWDYYETLGGGAGAGPSGPGMSARQCHMTNTLNTPVESLEMHYPLRVTRYQIDRAVKQECASDEFSGGNGLIREYEFLEDSRVSLLTERRNRPPWGLNGARKGRPGINELDAETLPAKASFVAKKGQKLRVTTPSGGSWRPAKCQD